VAHGPVGRGTVFGQVLWRSIVVATVGGAVIAGGLAAVFVPFDETNLADIGIFAYIGAVLGLVLGVLAGLMIGAIAGVTLVPYPTAHRVRRTTRITSVACVFAYLGLWTVGSWDEPLVVTIVVAGVLGAAATSNFLVNWYIRRAEPATR